MPTGKWLEPEPDAGNSLPLHGSPRDGPEVRRDDRSSPERPVEHGLGLPATAGPGEPARATDRGRSDPRAGGPPNDPGEQAIPIVLKQTTREERKKIVGVPFFIDYAQSCL